MILEQPVESNEHKEKELELLLRTLPKDLSDIWRAKSEEIDSLDEAILIVQNFISQRNVVKEKIFTKIHEIRNEQIKDEVREVVRHIGDTFGSSEHYLGAGQIGKVYRTSYAPHVCVKYITATNMQERHGNTMSQEIKYLEDLEGFIVEGIRVPMVYFDHMSEDISCYGMETIEGKSLDQIIADPHGCEFLDVLKKQDMKDVLRRMKLFIQKLHDEMKIVHRDLATRNIMVSATGDWYVIDFGKAKRIEIGDSTTEMSQATDFPSAENAIRKLFAVLN
jgi:tRNA A-37 threonylcarbamoyl transferase component Bud32